MEEREEEEEVDEGVSPQDAAEAQKGFGGEGRAGVLEGDFLHSICIFVGECVVLCRGLNGTVLESTAILHS